MTTRTHRIFLIGVQLKGANALLEILGGVLAIAVPPSVVTRIALHLSLGELKRHPADVVTAQLYQWAEHYSIGRAHFVGLYLLSHGTIKLALVIGLLKNQMWTYPTSLAVFSIFVVLETYFLLVNRSPAVGLLTLFDVALIVFIWREYKAVRARDDHIRGSFLEAR